MSSSIDDGVAATSNDEGAGCVLVTVWVAAFVVALEAELLLVEVVVVIALAGFLGGAVVPVAASSPSASSRRPS